ncbi:hypothetical protein ACFYSW_14735 [Rhodococcus aetherivorans]|uniref:hypothetical protein n=1 Tax=Rhodococcus aetherivorans TaxID=191292 RepID=UPI0036949DA1
MTCRACRSDLDHCHGTLVVHATVPVECTEPDCFDTSRVRHMLVVDCSDLAHGCGCTETYARVGTLRVS